MNRHFTEEDLALHHYIQLMIGILLDKNIITEEEFLLYKKTYIQSVNDELESLTFPSLTLLINRDFHVKNESKE